MYIYVFNCMRITEVYTSRVVKQCEVVWSTCFFLINVFFQIKRCFFRKKCVLILLKTCDFSTRAPQSSNTPTFRRVFFKLKKNSARALLIVTEFSGVLIFFSSCKHFKRVKRIRNYYFVCVCVSDTSSRCARCTKHDRTKIRSRLIAVLESKISCFVTCHNVCIMCW